MTALTLAKPDDLERVLRLVADFHSEHGITGTETARREALSPLLDGSPHGAIYLIGPPRAPIGYIAVSFSWSIALGGISGIIDEFYIRATVRGRGIGGEILSSLPRALSGAGLKALHLEVDREDATARKFYEKLHFLPRERYMLMTRTL